MAESENIEVAAIGKNRGSEIRVALSTFAGQRLLDIRTFLATDDTQELRATKKGVSLRFSRIGALRAALDAAEKKGLELGWIGEDE